MNQPNPLSFEPSRRGCRGCRKNSDLPRLLGGAALQRCGKGFVLNPASAAEVMLTASVRVFPQPLQPCRNRRTALRTGRSGSMSVIGTTSPIEELADARIRLDDSPKLCPIAHTIPRLLIM